MVYLLIKTERRWALYSEVRDGRWFGAPVFLKRGSKASCMITARILAGRTGEIEVIA